MAKIGRPGLPSDRRQQVWEMWKVGHSISDIAREVGSPPGSIFSILLPFGGIYQPPQQRRPGCLTLADREEISRGLAVGESYRSIGLRLGRSDVDDQPWRLLGAGAAAGIEPSMLMTELGAARVARSLAYLRSARSCGPSSPPSSQRTGRGHRRHPARRVVATLPNPLRSKPDVGDPEVGVGVGESLTAQRL